MSEEEEENTETTETVSEIPEERPQNEGDNHRLLNETTTRPSDPLFKPGDRVYARDKDGLMYEAVIRRRLYGANYQKQTNVAIAEEQGAVSDDEAERPVWQYFVHYLKWNVNWDRWIVEQDVYEPSDKIEQYAKRLMKEKHELQKQLSRKVKGKKAWQTIDGAEFLQIWTRRVRQINQESDVKGRDDNLDGEGKKQQEIANKKTRWSKAVVLNELKLRESGLTRKRQVSESNKVPLPLSLKKVLVEQWEFITKCNMVPQLPANKTVRQVLEEYYRGKTSFNTSSEDKDEEEKTTEEDQWRRMVDGIAQVFDEALPDRLLYREELLQLRVLEKSEVMESKKYSEVYGCEHLIRLFVRLPDMLKGVVDEEESRTILAKVNDFVRFLHKNHADVFNQTCRGLNDAELAEKAKIAKAAERKRKLAMAIGAESSEGDPPGKLRATGVDKTVPVAP